jgi:hypothetical protein
MVIGDQYQLVIDAATEYKNLRKAFDEGYIDPLAGAAPGGAGGRGL